MNDSFGTKLKMLRKEINLSQTALADKLFLSQDTISLWEKDKSLPDFTSLKRLAEIFDVSADYLLGIKSI